MDQRPGVAQQIRNIFNAPDLAEAQRLLGLALGVWQKEQPKLAQWAEQSLLEGLSVFGLPISHRVRLRTTNGLERINRELKRRTRVATLFLNSASYLRLVSALLSELDEEWMIGKIYLNMKPCDKYKRLALAANHAELKFTEKKLHYPRACHC